MTDEWKDAYSAGVFTEFLEQRAPGHTVADKKIFQKGFKDFKKEIDDSIASLDYFNDLNAYEKKELTPRMCSLWDALTGRTKLNMPPKP